MKITPGALVGCFLFLCSTPPMGRVPAPHVTLDIGYRPLGEVFDEMEKQTGWTIDRGCECGVLQDLVDPSVTFKVREISLKSAIVLMIVPLTPVQCGGVGWDVRNGRVSHYCGFQADFPESWPR